MTDETEKVNNLWNVKPAITIFDDHNSPIAKPQMMLSYRDEQQHTTINSLAITYSKDTNKEVFSINDVTGNDNIQANLFPEDKHEENKFCVDPEYKPYNNTVISAWSAESANNRFFKLHSNGGYYSSAYNTIEISSKGNNLFSCSSNDFYISNINSVLHFNTNIIKHINLNTNNMYAYILKYMFMSNMNIIIHIMLLIIINVKANTLDNTNNHV